MKKFQIYTFIIVAMGSSQPLECAQSTLRHTPLGERHGRSASELRAPSTLEKVSHGTMNLIRRKCANDLPFADEPEKGFAPLSEELQDIITESPIWNGLEIIYPEYSDEMLYCLYLEILKEDIID